MIKDVFEKSVNCTPRDKRLCNDEDTVSGDYRKCKQVQIQDTRVLFKAPKVLFKTIGKQTLHRTRSWFRPCWNSGMSYLCRSCFSSCCVPCRRCTLGQLQFQWVWRGRRAPWQVCVLLHFLRHTRFRKLHRKTPPSCVLVSWRHWPLRRGPSAFVWETLLSPHSPATHTGTRNYIQTKNMNAG